jgi:hypothetical protein
MEYKEIIPETAANKQFPMGDITDKFAINRAGEWLEASQEFDRSYYMNRLRTNRAPLGPESTQKTHQAALGLCREWNSHVHEDSRLASTGYLIAQDFLNETRFLPPASSDFSSELFTMQLYDYDKAATFASHAWYCMRESHPEVYKQFSQLQNFADKLLFAKERSQKERDHLSAGLVLPYVLSSNSRLVGYTSGHLDFTGMEVGTPKKLLQKKFGKLFTNKIRLADEHIFHID